VNIIICGITQNLSVTEFNISVYPLQCLLFLVSYAISLCHAIIMQYFRHNSPEHYMTDQLFYISNILSYFIFLNNPYLGKQNE